MAHERRFRFGVMAPRAGSAAEFRETARRAEALGYSTLFVPDHFVDHPLAPMPALAVAAGVTTTLRVGSLVLGNDYRHPVVLAHEAATLDLLSDGRLELGMGAGWMTADYEKAGMTLDPPSVRIARLAESITILKGLFADGAFTFAGDHYTVTDLDGEPKPVQRPHPPFIVGGGAPRILGLAAREAQIVGVNANLRSGDGTSSDAANSLAPDPTDRKLDWVREAAGERFDQLEIQTIVGFVHDTDDPQSIAEVIAGGFGVSPDEALLSPVTLVGTRSQMVDLLHARRERWQMSYHVIPQEAIEDFAPVVAALAGT
ncbi:MAG: TIGR03621 family F420-dependent LLM class oxidoreductase [Acidimicrobiia bacterium]